MCRNLTIGCSALVAILVVCGIGLSLWIGAVVRRVAPPLPVAPVSVAGDCPKEEAMAWAMGYSERDAAMADALDAASSGAAEDRTVEAPFAGDESVDLQAARAERDRIARTEVPACLKELRDAEVEVLDFYHRSVEFGYEGSRFSRMFRGLGVLASFRQGYGPRKDRVAEGYALLGARLGEDLSEFVPYPDPAE